MIRFFVLLFCTNSHSVRSVGSGLYCGGSGSGALSWLHFGRILNIEEENLSWFDWYIVGVVLVESLFMAMAERWVICWATIYSCCKFRELCVCACICMENDTFSLCIVSQHSARWHLSLGDNSRWKCCHHYERASKRTSEYVDIRAIYHSTILL